MRINEQNQTASFSTRQMYNMNIQNSIDKDNYTISGGPSEEFGLNSMEVRALKKHLGRS
ncbi:hypothetical protein [Lederbergia graminis]|uniref:Uncharacterized protein n=1 Tax=Lederbergia graminis TaxID=735518 RepID=A0ABW0LQ22_9BACI